MILSFSFTRKQGLSGAADFRPSVVFHSSTLAQTVKEEELFKSSIETMNVLYCPLLSLKVNWKCFVLDHTSDTVSGVIRSPKFTLQLSALRLSHWEGRKWCPTGKLNFWLRKFWNLLWKVLTPRLWVPGQKPLFTSLMRGKGGNLRVDSKDEFRKLQIFKKVCHPWVWRQSIILLVWTLNNMSDDFSFT